MSRRLLAFVCALAVLASAAPAVAAPPPYAHVWQVEGQVGGDLGGASRKKVSRDEMTLSLSQGKFLGHLRYADVIGIQHDTGRVSAQSASIEMTLTGKPAEGGAVAAGTFVGLARVLSRSVPTLDAFQSVEADSGGVMVLYEISGHWGAKLSGGVADGELVYERATGLSKGITSTDVYDPTWFNRLSVEPLGGPQTFRIEVIGLAAGPGAPGSGTTTGAGSSPSAAAAGAGSGGSRLGFLAYVARAFAGNPGVPAAPVPLALSQRARALKDAAPPGATALPDDSVAINVDVAGSYLDAKNRAAGLLTSAGPAGDAGKSLGAAWQKLGPRIPPHDLTALADLAARQKVPGADDVSSDIRNAIRMGGARDPALRAWDPIVSAVGAARPLGSVLAATASEQAAVAGATIPRSGPLADAVLAAVQSSAAPPAAVAVREMARDATLDASGTVTGGGFPNRVLTRVGGRTESGAGSLGWDSGSGRVSLAPRVWLAYGRADGSLFWLAGPDVAVALADGTLRGAGFTVSRAYLVDASRVGRILAVYDLR